jgi:hypothetical protein
MEKTIIAFGTTQDAVRAGLVIQKAVPSTRLTQTRAVVVIGWCANLIVAGQALVEAKIPFTLVSE